MRRMEWENLNPAHLPDWMHVRDESPLFLEPWPQVSKKPFSMGSSRNTLHLANRCDKVRHAPVEMEIPENMEGD
jgi:hypothetical protein